MAKNEKKSKCVHAVLKTMKWSFIVFFVCLSGYLVSLFFRAEQMPACICNPLIRHFVPTNLVVECDQVSVGFRHGLQLTGVRVRMADQAEPMASAESVDVFPIHRRVRFVRLRYPRLPESYYLPGNLERNARVEAVLPRIPKFSLVLIEPDILSARPAYVEATVEVKPQSVVFDAIRLSWREKNIQGLDGVCSVDLASQKICGEVDGHAIQSQIRPLLEALDVPVSLPYIDAFTEVPGQVRATCSWEVNLINNDFDLLLDLHPNLGRYNGVKMRKADGQIRLHSYTRGTSLNYRTQVGPIETVNADGLPLKGTVTIEGTNGYNVVRVEAKSGMPLAEILRIGGFTGDYVTDKVIGETTGDLEFRFPRAMTNNYEVLNGGGHVTVENGHLMRLNLFAGLTKILADHVPGVRQLVDQSRASVDYRIENGVIRTDNASIDGGVFSIKMDGSFDTVKNALDFNVRVLFSRDDTLMGKYFIRPVTWPFSKLLLEFKLTGSSDKPQWEYISIIDRVINIIK